MNKELNNVVLVRKEVLFEKEGVGRKTYNFYLLILNTKQFIRVEYTKFGDKKEPWKWYSFLNNSIDFNDLPLEFKASE